LILTNISSLLKRDGVKNLIPQMKEEKAAARDDNKKSRRTQYVHIYIYICLQFGELFSHLPVPVLLRQSMLPTLSGSTSEHRGSHKHRGFEHRGSHKHRGSNDSIDFHRHRGLECRGFECRGFEHRGSTQFHTQHRVATRSKLP
jgi:hypothetical protein